MIGGKAGDRAVHFYLLKNPDAVVVACSDQAMPMGEVMATRLPTEVTCTLCRSLVDQWVDSMRDVPAGGDEP